MIIRELITKLGFSVDSAALKRGEDAVNNIKNRTNEASEAAKGATSNIGLMLQAYLSFASASSLARVADAAQSLRARLAMVPQTIGDAGAAFDELAERANFARTSINAYGTLYVRLAGATKDYLKTQEEVLTVTDAISQALAINGATTEEAASVTLQLSQAFQKGKLDGDEFRSFMEGLSTDFKEKMVVALQDVTGNTKITLGALYDMSANGELVAKDLALAFQKMAPEIRKQMLSIPLTIGGATQIVRNDFTAMIDRMNRESMAVTRIAGTIVKSFDFIESGIYKVKDAFGGFGNLVSYIGSLITTVIAGKIIKSLVTLDRKTFLLRAKWLLLAGAVLAAALIVQDVFAAINGEASLLGTSFDQLANKIDVIVEKWRKLTKGNIESFELFVKRMVTFSDVGGGAFSSPRAYDPRVVEQNQLMGWLAKRANANNVQVTINVDVPPGTPEAQARSIASISGDALAQYLTNVAGAR